MSKAKMKCAVCHKAFKSSKATQLLCDDCERKRRKEKATSAPPAKPVQQSVGVTAGEKPAWLANATVRDEAHPYSTETPAQERQPRLGRGQQRQERAKSALVVKGARTPQAEKAPEPAPPSRPAKSPKPPTPPYQPTAAEIAAIEQRYRELAQPEFDGIRTQIAHELRIPKRVVREVVAALRKREHLPSWWEIQTYQGTPEDLERIKTAYSAYLPVPPVGVHRILAKELGLPATTVYQGIAAVRQALGLPAYNPPELHPEMSRAETADGEKAQAAS